MRRRRTANQPIPTHPSTPSQDATGRGVAMPQPLESDGAGLGELPAALSPAAPPRFIPPAALAPATLDPAPATLDPAPPRLAEAFPAVGLLGAPPVTEPAVPTPPAPPLAPPAPATAPSPLPPSPPRPPAPGSTSKPSCIHFATSA